MSNPRSPPMAPDLPRILIIEDELLIALLMEEMVRQIGYRVSSVAHTMAMARQEFVKRNFDAVLLDINIGGRYQPEIADFLLDIGVPLAFVTGYDYLIEPRASTT
jgi:DNA-binding response OmpR family regulator